MRRRLPAIYLTLLLLGLLAMIISGSVAELLVVPLLRILYVARILYDSLPQALVWGAFIAVALFVVLRSLWREQSEMLPPPAVSTLSGRVTRWANVIRHSHQDNHARWLLAQRVGQVALDLLASKYQCSTDQMRQRLERDTLDIAPELRAYLRAGLASYVPGGGAQRPFWQALLPGQQQFITSTNPLDLELDRVIQYLEQTMQQSIGESL